jgi:hypothetical protein
MVALRGSTQTWGHLSEQLSDGEGCSIWQPILGKGVEPGVLCGSPSKTQGWGE